MQARRLRAALGRGKLSRWKEGLQGPRREVSRAHSIMLTLKSTAWG